MKLLNVLLERIDVVILYLGGSTQFRSKSILLEGINETCMIIIDGTMLKKGRNLQSRLTINASKAFLFLSFQRK